MIGMTKLCTKCCEVKPQNKEFFRYSKKRLTFHSWCRCCENEYSRRHAKSEHGKAVADAWRAANPEKLAKYQATTNARNRTRRKQEPDRFRSYDLKKRIGITLAEKNAKLLKQGNTCAICKTAAPNTKGTWFADHDHKTGVFRGVLCGKCNAMLGYANDSPFVLHRGILYLAVHGSRETL